MYRLLTSAKTKIWCGFIRLVSGADASPADMAASDSVSWSASSLRRTANTSAIPTTGGKPRLLGISKRGNRYLRKNLVHGARAVLPKLAERDTPIGRWLRELLERQHKNVVVVALANKLARICWAVLSGDRGFAEGVAEMH